MLPRIRFGLLLAVSLSLTAIAYGPILANYFYNDDFVYLYEINNHSLLEFLLRPHGGHVQASRNLIFYLVHAASGTNPMWYFGLVLLTHLANVALLFVLISRFTGSTGLACFGSTLWGSSPLHEGTLGWYSVYGQAVVALITLGLLVDLTRCQAAGMARRTYAPLFWYVALLVAATSFGVGIAIAVVFPIIAFVLVPDLRLRRWAALGLCTLPVVVLGLYTAVYRLYERTSGAPTVSPWQSLTDQLLHVPKLLRVLLAFLSYGASNALSGLLHTETTFPSVWTFTAGALYVFGIALILAQSTPATKRQLLVCVVLAVSSYGIIALGRAELWGVDGAVQARYHYVGMIALVVTACLILHQVSEYGVLRRLRTDLTLLGCLGLVCVVLIYHRPSIDHHDRARLETTNVVAAMRSLILQHAADEDVYIPNRPFSPAGGYMASLSPGWVGIYIIFFPQNTFEGRRVYFVESDERILAMARTHPQTRLAALLVAPGRDQHTRALGDHAASALDRAGFDERSQARSAGVENTETRSAWSLWNAPLNGGSLCHVSGTAHRGRTDSFDRHTEQSDHLLSPGAVPEVPEALAFARVFPLPPEGLRHLDSRER